MSHLKCILLRNPDLDIQNLKYHTRLPLVVNMVTLCFHCCLPQANILLNPSKEKNVVLKKGWIVIHVVCSSYWSNNNHYLRDVQWYFTVRLPTNHRLLGYMYKEIHCSSAFWLTLQSYKSEKTFCYFLSFLLS